VRGTFTGYTTQPDPRGGAASGGGKIFVIPLCILLPFNAIVLVDDGALAHVAVANLVLYYMHAVIRSA